MSEKARQVSSKTDKKITITLASLEKRENRIYAELAKSDSAKAKLLLEESKLKYVAIRSQLAEAKNNQSTYLPAIDTIRTSLSFLYENNEFLSQSTNTPKNLVVAIEKISQLQNSFSNAETLTSFIDARKQQLAAQVGGLVSGKEFKKFNAEAYYFSAQIKEYKEILKDKKKIEKKALEILVRSKVFKDFMRKNSQLASLFHLPDPDNLVNMESLQGLQTRAQITDLIQERIRAGGPGASEVFSTQLQEAQTELNKLREQTALLVSSNKGFEMPSFKPNNQKTKSFINRLEFGGNLQSQKATYYFPVTSDLAGTVGYKLNDKSTIGFGASYKIGWGKNWDNIEITHQGLGIRSFIDYQLKGVLYVTGGYEQNYRSVIKDFRDLPSISGWQQSGLIGLSKSYKVSKKINGNVQILWDFLSYNQIPTSQPIIFRLGYKLK